jgi:putative FmdB family regulatory protein
MPSYTYRCGKCGQTFERFETISEHETLKRACPKCGNENDIASVPVPFVAMTSRKS